MTAPEFGRIQAAAVDGRMHTVFHRQEQLERLCKTLVNNVNEIKDAISTDYNHTTSEIAIEYSLALTAVKKYYETPKPKEFLEEEYLIAHGKDAGNRRAPAGIVYVEPTQHTMFYSVIVPLAAAFAAGNCVIVLLENNLRTLSGLLKRLLTEALDTDVFAVAPSPIKDQKLLSNAICVLQNGIEEEAPRINQLTHLSTSSTVAVVDRTADVQVAARELVAARFGFGGRSPYAPDVVLVNEFRKKDFLQAVVSECVSLGSGVEMNGSAKGKTTSGNTVAQQIAAFKKVDHDLRAVVQESNLAVVDVSSREVVLSEKITAPVLAVHSIKSLDDAIDLIGSQSESTALAAYHFGSPAAGKYLSQFIAADVSFVNHIPRVILLGPALPTGHPVHPTERFPLDLFTIPRAAYINPPKDTEGLWKAVANPNLAQRMLAEASKPLAQFKRAPGGSLGFFELGFVMNAALILVSTLTVSATGGVYLWKYTRPS